MYAHAHPSADNESTVAEQTYKEQIYKYVESICTYVFHSPSEEIVKFSSHLHFSIHSFCISNLNISVKGTGQTDHTKKLKVSFFVFFSCNKGSSTFAVDGFSVFVLRPYKRPKMFFFPGYKLQYYCVVLETLLQRETTSCLLHQAHHSILQNAVTVRLPQVLKTLLCYPC